jgi:hypothetical protein
VTKLRAALPPDVVAELERLRCHVAVVEPVREYEAPLLGELLRASPPRLLSVETDVKAESPPELAEAMRNRYRPDSSS